MARKSELRVVIAGDASQLERAYAQAKASTDRFGNHVQSGMGRAAGAVSAFAKVGALSAGLGVASILKAGVAYEQQMKRVQAVTDASGAQFKQLGDLAKDLGAKTKYSAGEAASAMYELGSAGFKANDMAKVLPGTLSLAAASGIELKDAAEISANALRGFGLANKDSAHVADVLAQAVNASSVEMTDLQSTMKYIGPVAKTTGQSFEDMVAAVEMMGDAGIKGEQAGTTLRGALVRLTNPTKSVTAGLDELGLKAQDLHGPKGLKPLPEIIRLVETHTKGMDKATRNAALANIFGTEALSGMVTVVDGGSKKLERLADANRHAEGAAKKAADTMNDTVAGAWDNFTGSIETASITLYEKFAPALKKGLAGAAGGINDLSKLPGKVKATFEALKKEKGSGGAAIGAMITAGFEKIPWDKLGSTMAAGFGKAMDFSKKVSVGVQDALGEVFANLDEKALAEKGASLALKLFATLTDPIFWLKHWKDALAVISIAFPVSRLGGLAGKLGGAIIKPLSGLAKTAGPVVARAFGSVITRASNALFEGLIKISPRVAAFVVHALPNAIGHGAAFVKRFGTIGVLAVTTFARGLGLLAKAAWGAFNGVLDALGDFASQSWAAAKKVGPRIVSAIANGLVKLASTVGKALLDAYLFVPRMAIRFYTAAGKLAAGVVVGIAKGVAKIAPTVGKALLDAYLFVPRMAIRFYTAAGKLGLRIVVGLAKGVAGLAGTIGRALQAGIRKVGEWERNALSAGVKFAGSIVKGVGRSLGSLGHTIAGGIRGAFTKLRAMAGEIAGLAAGLGKAIVTGIVNGLKGLPGRIKDAVGGAVGWAAGKVGVGDVTESIARRIGAAAQGGGASGPGATGAGTSGLQIEARQGLGFIQSHFGGVKLTSGRRSAAENAAVGGAPGSDHLTGLALDLVPSEGWSAAGTARLDRIAAWARQSKLIRWIGWRGVPGHGPGDHLHLSFMDRVKGDVTRGTAPLSRIAGGAMRGLRGVGRIFAGGRGGKGDVYADLASAAGRAGFAGSNRVIATAVAMAESGGRGSARNTNTNGTTDLGWWQINSVHGFDPKKLTTSIDYNARAAHDVWGRQGWNAWTMYRNHGYERYMDAARRAVLGTRGGSATSGAGSAGGTGSHGPSAADKAAARKAAAEKAATRAANKFVSAAQKAYSPAKKAAAAAGASVARLVGQVSRGDRNDESADRIAGWSDEDLSTTGGRARATSELTAKKGRQENKRKLLIKQLKRVTAQAAAERQIIHTINARLKKAPTKAKSALRDRLQKHEQAYAELQDAAAALGGQIADIKLDIAETQKGLDSVSIAGAGEDTNALAQVSKDIEVRRIGHQNQMDAAQKALARAQAGVTWWDGQIAATKRQLAKKGLTKKQRLALRKELRRREDRRAERADEVVALGAEVADLTIDIAEDMAASAEAAGAAETAQANAGQNTAEPQSAMDKYSDALSLVDLKERAGQLTAEQANAQRTAIRGAAAGGAYGALSEREYLQVLGDIKEAQGAAAEAMGELTAAIKELKDEVSKQNELTNAVMATSLKEAWRAMADMVSGQIAGQIAGRAQTAGSGSVVRY